MSVAPPYCGVCGATLVGARHDECLARSDLEPPRFCTRCRRRMIVQVMPTGWTAHCAEHGSIFSDAGQTP